MAADATSLDVDAGQVIQIMLQFMKENGLSSSMKVLQEETGVFLNTSEDSNLLRSRIISGQWDLVLKVRTCFVHACLRIGDFYSC